MSSVNNIEQNRSSAVKQELLNMDAPGSNDTAQYDETNSNKKKKLIKVQGSN